MSRASQVLTLHTLVDELLTAVTATEDTTWSPTREAVSAVAERAATALAARHPAVDVGPPVPAALWAVQEPARPPKAGPRRRHVRAAGLLEQLADVAGHAWAATGDTSTRSTPDSRVPPGGRHVELLADLTAGIVEAWHQYAPTPGARTVEGMLRGLLGRATDTIAARDADGAFTGETVPALTDEDVDDLVRLASSWVRTARLALGWDVPVVALDVTCPECDGWRTLRVRTDASSDVWCSGHLIGPPTPGQAYPRPCGQRWPRHRWIVLLDHLSNRPEAS